MNLYEFLEENSLSLPIAWDTYDGDFLSFVEQRFEIFQKSIDKLDSVQDSVANSIKAKQEAIKKCCNSIVTAIKHSWKGDLGQAYVCFSDGIKQVRSEIEQRTVRLDNLRELGRMYRIRLTDDSLSAREDLFHIPFEKRHKIHTQRYSIPGLPCLYLSGSLATCWKELQTPDTNKIYASAFEGNEKLDWKILNFSNHPSRIHHRLNPEGNPQFRDDTDLIKSHVVLWPLMASCSIIVRHREDPYKPEYIIPQMLLQWVAKTKGVNGVCYFSTHTKDEVRKDYHPGSNYVFPAQSQQIHSRGYCPELREAFKLTLPCKCQLSVGSQGKNLCEKSQIDMLQKTLDSLKCEYF